VALKKGDFTHGKNGDFTKTHGILVVFSLYYYILMIMWIIIDDYVDNY